MPQEPQVTNGHIRVNIGISEAIQSSPLGSYLGFTPLPALYLPLLALTLLSYVVLTQLVKT